MCCLLCVVCLWFDCLFVCLVFVDCCLLNGIRPSLFVVCCALVAVCLRDGCSLLVAGCLDVCLFVCMLDCLLCAVCVFACCL